MSSQSQVMKYLTDRPGSLVYVEDIAAALDIEPKSARQAINNARNGHREVFGQFVEIVGRGGPWRYMPGSSNSGRTIFEQIGVTKSGAIVVESEDGALYLATEL